MMLNSGQLKCNVCFPMIILQMMQSEVGQMNKL